MARVGSQRYNGVLGNVILIFISSYNNPYRFIFNYDLWPVKKIGILRILLKNM